MVFTFLQYPDPFVWWHVVLFFIAYAWGAFVIGTFGVGGGAIFVPAFLMLPGTTVPLAIGTVYMGCVPVTTSRFIQLWRLGRLCIKSASPLMVGAAVGALGAQALLPHVPKEASTILVAVLAMLAGIEIQWKVTRDCWARRRQAIAQATKPALDEVPPQTATASTELEVGNGDTASPAREQGSANAPSHPAATSEPTTLVASAAAHDSASVAVAPTSRPLPASRIFSAGMILLGLVAGFLSSMSGTGGPLILYPLWILYDPKVDMKELVAYSSPFALILVCVSAISAAIFADIEISLVAGMAVVGTVCIWQGGLLMERVGDSLLRLSVGVVLIVVGVVVTVRTLVTIVD